MGRKPKAIMPTQENGQTNGVVENMLEGFEPQEDSVLVESKEEKVPHKTDKEWHEYVMKQFREDELYEKRPTVDGLRRVTELLIGEIVESGPRIMQSPSMQNNERAVSEFWITINRDGDLLKYGDAADACLDNILTPEYAKYPTTMAVTRAEGRVLRKALGLCKIISAEEGEDFKPEGAKYINTTQLAAANLMASRNNINLGKMLDAFKLIDKVDKYSKLTYESGAKLVAQLNKYQQYDPDKKNQGEKIPEDLLGYESDWKDKC